MPDVNTYQIEIRGLKLYGYHGVYPEENKLGQTFQIDLTLTVARATEDINDNPKNVISYADIIDRVTDIFFAQSYKLIETLADTILLSLAPFKKIQHARIHIKKLHAPIPQTLSHVGVIIEKSY